MSRMSGRTCSSSPGRRSRAAEAARHHLADRGEVVDALDRLDAVAAVARLERQAVDELHQRRHRVLPPRWAMSTPSMVRGVCARPSTLRRPTQALLRLDGEDLRLHVLLDLAALAQLLQGRDRRRAAGPPSRTAGRRWPPASPASISRISLSFLPSSTRRSERICLRYSSLVTRKLHGAVHWRMLCSRHGRNQRQRCRPR